MKNRKWVKKDLPTKRIKLFENSHPPKVVDDDLTPSLLFEKFFDDDVIQLMVEQSLIYAKQKGDHRYTVSAHEMKGFLGILILSGYVQLPRRRMFWEQSPDVRNEIALKFMARDRFEEIMKYMHLADNSNLPTGDKFAKLRPLFDLLGFKRDIVDVYSRRFSMRETVGRPVGKVVELDRRVKPEVRHDGLDHLIAYADKQRVCPVCRKKANFVCMKCDIGLHPKECFVAFHQH